MVSLVDMLLKDMETAAVAPTNQTLAILVKLYGRAQDLDSAMAYMDALPAKHGFEPNNAAHLALVSPCVSCGNLPAAVQAFRKVSGPDGKAYGTLIGGALKLDVAEAIR